MKLHRHCSRLSLSPGNLEVVSGLELTVQFRRNLISEEAVQMGTAPIDDDVDVGQGTTIALS